MEPGYAASLIQTDDVLLARRLAEVATASGVDPVVVPSATEFQAALIRVFPILAVIDLQTSEAWPALLLRCRTSPQTDHIPIFALARAHAEPAGIPHTDLSELVAEIWPRASAPAELARVLPGLLSPPVRFLAGWDEPLDPAARRGVRAFNQGDYYAQHEYFEEAWIAERRPIRDLYQGILQVGLAFFQMERNNWTGAVKMFQRGLPYLRDLPPTCRGLALDRFRSAAETVFREILANGPAAMAGFNRHRLPAIELADEDTDISFPGDADP